MNNQSKLPIDRAIQNLIEGIRNQTEILEREIENMKRIKQQGIERWEQETKEWLTKIFAASEISYALYLAHPNPIKRTWRRLKRKAALLLEKLVEKDEKRRYYNS